MNSEKPLEGMTVLLTRSRENNAKTRPLLDEKGAAVLELPTVSILPPEDFSALDQALANLEKYDWVAFTSRNAVRAVVNRLKSLGKPASVLGSVRLAAVGPSTQAELRLRELSAIEPTTPTASTLAAMLCDLSGANSRILAPEGDLARPDLKEGLKKCGAQVDAPVVYRTKPPTEVASSVLRSIRNGEVDVVVVASPSAIRNLAELLGKKSSQLQKVKLVCIGPTTAAEVEELGLSPAAVAKSPDTEGLVEAIEELASGTK